MGSWGALNDGQGPSPIKFLGKYGHFPRLFTSQLVVSFPQWPRCLPGWALGKILTFAKVAHELGSWGALNNGQAHSQVGVARNYQ
jgi:hypothetical protein